MNNKDIMHPVKEELIDCALSEKAAASLSGFLCICVIPAMPVLPADLSGSRPAGETGQLDCSSGPLSDLM